MSDAPSLSMTDEEGDIEAFKAYLTTLPEESLWDVLAHLDREQYPRRYETVEREITRRKLFFVTPYTAAELQLRSVAGFCVMVAVLAAIVKGLPAIAGFVTHLAQDFGAQATDAAGHRLAVSFTFTDRELDLLGSLLRWLRDAALVGVGASGVCLLLALWRWKHRRVRPDLLATIGVFALLALLLTRLAWL